MATACCYSVSPSQRHESRTRARSGERNRGDLREEPYAGKPHVRICEGKAEWPRYSTAFAGLALASNWLLHCTRRVSGEVQFLTIGTPTGGSHEHTLLR